jgi:hypothetical protein|tara:strand:+ start:329 stop:847 length:519 start_codon:yes stop_codon:yes gene_type:complete
MTAKLIKHYEPLSVHRIQDYTFKEKLVEDNGDTVRYLPAYRDADGNPTAALVTFYRPAVNILNAKDAKGNYVVNRAVAGSVTLAPLTAIIGKDAVAEFKLAVGQSVEISFQAEVGTCLPAPEAPEGQISRRLWKVGKVTIIQEAPDPEWEKSADIPEGAVIEKDEVVEELPW